MNIYWIGNGVFSAKDGKDYGYGEKLPDDLDKAMVARQIAKGNMAENVPSAVMPIDNSAELRKCQAGLLEATNKIKELDKECDDLATERDSLAKQLDEAKQTIQQLTTQLTTPQPAGPKGDKK